MLIGQDHCWSRNTLEANLKFSPISPSVFSISTHRLWTHFACLLQRHVWIWIHQALLLRKQKSDEKKICWLTLLIAPCYSYCIWWINPAFCSLKHWETPRDSSCLDSSRLVGQLHTCETAMVLSVQYYEYYVSLQRKQNAMHGTFAGASSRSSLRSSRVFVSLGLPLAPFWHPFGIVLASFWHLFEPFGFFRFSLLLSLTNTSQTPCHMGGRWRQSTWWHGRLCPLTFRHLGSFLGRWCFRGSFCLPETMKSQDVSDYEDANCELSMQPIRTGLCVAVWHVLCACSVAWNWNPWRRITEDYHRRLFTTQNVFRFPI